MSRVFLYLFLCTKWLDKNEKLSVEQTRVLTIVHYPPFLLSVYFDYEPSSLPTRNSIPHWECFFTSRTTMSDWPKGGCSLLRFLWGFFFPWMWLVSNEVRPSEMIFCHCQATATTLLCEWPFWFFLSSPYTSPADHRESVYWAYFQRGLFPGVLWYPRFLDRWPTHLCHTVAVIASLPDITLIHFWYILDYKTSISHWNQMFWPKFSRT